MTRLVVEPAEGEVVVTATFRSGATFRLSVPLPSRRTPKEITR